MPITVRELLKSLVDTTRDIDQPLVVRLVRRDGNGSVVETKTLPVERVFDGHSLTVENESLINCSWERC